MNLLNSHKIAIQGDDENVNFQKLNSHRNPPMGTKSISECHFYWTEEFIEPCLGLKFINPKLGIRTSCDTIILICNSDYVGLLGNVFVVSVHLCKPLQLQ